MKYGFSLIMRGSEATRESFHAMAEKAEQLELDSLWVSSHVVVPPLTKSKYPGRADGQFPPLWLEGYWDPWTVLGYLAAVTSKVTLGTSVLILPMHDAIEAARNVADLDQLSQGRFVFGVGAGWFEEEFEVLGRPFKERGARLNEGLDVCKSLWSEERPSFEGRYYNFRDVYFFPKPVQRPGPPIWVGGSAPVSLRRAARYGGAWHPHRPTFETFKEKLPKLHEYLEQEGRPRDALQIAAKLMLTFQDGPPGPGQLPTEGTPQMIVDAIRRYQDLGVNHFVFDYMPEARDTGLAAMERFAQEIRPKL